VTELILDGDFFRRAIRPEDLGFLTFETAVAEDSFNLLSSLMSQRALLCVHETGEARLPEEGDERFLADWRSFYDPEHVRIGQQALEPLERHAFGFLAHQATAELVGQIEDALAISHGFIRDQLGRLNRLGFTDPGARHIALQFAPLGRSLDAGASRLPPPIRDRFRSGVFKAASDSLEATAQRHGLSLARHCYWQFYLPGALAPINLLHGLARTPVTICEYVGARLIYDAERLLVSLHLDGVADARAIEQASRTFLMEALDLQAQLSMRLGPSATARAAEGAARMSRLMTLARAGLAEQLNWIAGLDWAEQAAAQIHQHIVEHHPNIDRDTFVEPREMCSTTHVHDEHRLVVIETGRMQFWGDVGGRHAMGPGDMILVPKGRLHGSTVLSESCTYHQPIIPDDWRDRAPAWLAAA
jgi:hypothetical protein